MAKNCLIAAGCHQVARIVARSPQLEDLRVSGTRVPSVGTLALVRTLLANDALRLRRLDLSDNSFEAADSYEALAQLLAAPQVLSSGSHYSIMITFLQGTHAHYRLIPNNCTIYLPVIMLSILHFACILSDSLRRRARVLPRPPRSAPS
jgi:hypothetical protein